MPLIRRLARIAQARPSITATNSGQLIGLPYRTLFRTSISPPSVLLMYGRIFASAQSAFIQLTKVSGTFILRSISYIKVQSTLLYTFSQSRKRITTPESLIGSRVAPRYSQYRAYTKITACTVRTLLSISLSGRKAYQQSPTVQSSAFTKRYIKISIQILQSTFIRVSGRQYLRLFLSPLFLKRTVSTPSVYLSSRELVAWISSQRAFSWFTKGAPSSLNSLRCSLVYMRGGLRSFLQNSEVSLSIPGDFLVAALRIDNTISRRVIGFVIALAVRSSIWALIQLRINCYELLSVGFGLNRSVQYSCTTSSNSLVLVLSTPCLSISVSIVWLDYVFALQKNYLVGFSLSNIYFNSTLILRLRSCYSARQSSYITITAIFFSIVQCSILGSSILCLFFVRFSRRFRRFPYSFWRSLLQVVITIDRYSFTFCLKVLQLPPNSSVRPSNLSHFSTFCRRVRIPRLRRYLP